MKWINYLSLLLLLFSCLSPRKEKKIVPVAAPIFELSLTTKPSHIEVMNVNFSKEGASFGKDPKKNSYLYVDSIPFIPDNFNMSCWFRVEGEEGKIAQALFKAIDTAHAHKQFGTWIAGFRITGSLNSNFLSAKNFSKSETRSREYYDLPLLELGKYYFLSINKKEKQIAFYINAELYKEYTLPNDTEIGINSLIFGALNFEGPYVNQFYGRIRNFEIYRQPLSPDEIYSVSVKHFNEIQPFNDAFELSKFNIAH
ncbi:MAG: LamG-like jellyroll fold domain-containing protein [Flavobacteriaceae bacterium]